MAALASAPAAAEPGHWFSPPVFKTPATDDAMRTAQDEQQFVGNLTKEKQRISVLCNDVKAHGAPISRLEKIVNAASHEEAHDAPLSRLEELIVNAASHEEAHDAPISRLEELILNAASHEEGSAHKLSSELSSDEELEKRKVDAALWWAAMTAEKDTEKAVRGGTAYADFVDILRISDNDGGTPIRPWAPSPGARQGEPASASIFSMGRASRRRIIAH